MKPQIIGTAAWVGNMIESAVSAVRTGRPIRAPRGARVVAYRGLGNATRLTVRGRVVRQASSRSAPIPNRDIPSYAHLVSVYRAFDVQEIPDVVVTASLLGSSTTVTTDSGGYFEAELPPPTGETEWSAGWHKVTLDYDTEIDADDSTSSADVFVPDIRARLLLVSDLDDTAMDSETHSNWRMIRTVLFRNARRRQPVPGVPELYQALHKGRDGVSNPVCYISSGAWNLYDIVLDYLDTHGLPSGGMYLNDWGSRERRFRTIAHSHKSTHVAALMKQFPTLPLLLAGDDTQEDPELYARAALENRGRVAAIWIRDVVGDSGRRARVESLRRECVAAGVEFIYARESSVFADQARNRGWIASE